MLVIARDATERVNLQNQLRQSQKLEAMGQLTGGIAHDFNNLLAAVALNIEALQRRLPENGDAKAIAEQIEKVAGRGQAMTRRLLAFALRADALAGPDHDHKLSAVTTQANRPVKPYFDEKSYGGTLSGAIIPDTLFFFLGYDELKRTSAPSAVSVSRRKPLAFISITRRIESRTKR